MSDWTVAALSDIAEVRFSNVDKKAHSGEISVRLCNYMDVYTNNYITADLSFMEATATPMEIERFRVEQGDTIITKDSETPDDIGIPAVVVDEIPNLVCGYHLALIKPRRDKVDSVYLSKQLGTRQTAIYFSRLANGSTRYGLSSSAIATTAIPLATLPEQRRISQILLSLDQTIQETASLIEKYRQIKAGLMQNLFTRGIKKDGKLRPPREEAPELYKKSPIGWIPREWNFSGLSGKASPNRPYLKTGPFGSSLKGEHWVDVGHPVITIGALGEGSLIESELLFVSASTAKRLVEFQLKPGDVVFSRVADVGRSVAITEAHAGWIMSSNLMRLSLDPKQVLPDFLQQQLSFDTRLKEQIRSKVNAGGREVANSDILNRLIFAWPQYDEQHRILDKVRSLDRCRVIESDNLKKLRLCKQGLMHDLLTGRVRVNTGGA